jgi:hypothetical protein
MKEITVESGQTIADLSIQHYGCIEGAALIISDNGFELSTELFGGQKVLIRKEVPTLTDKNKAIAEQLNVKQIVVNTTYKRVLESGDGFYDDSFYSTTFYN